MSESASDTPGRSKTRPQKRAERSDQAVPVNKTLEIRRVARQMVSVGKPPRPIEIVSQLKARGIDITSAHVSTALANTDFAFRRNRPDWERPQVVFPDLTLALSLVSIDDVFKAREFVADLGGIEKAKAALVALVQFGGDEAKSAPRPVSNDGEIVSLEGRDTDRSPSDDGTKG
jgi:hypothetical protein